MSEKRKHVYEGLLEGATQGLSGKALYEFVLERCPKATSKKIVRASLLAFADPDLKDRNVLHTIYALAIAHRLNEVGDIGDSDEHRIPRRKVPYSERLKSFVRPSRCQRLPRKSERSGFLRTGSRTLA